MSKEKEDNLREKAREQLKSFLDDCGLNDFKGKRVLEIGFKNGLFLDECLEAGLISVGTEINKDYYEEIKKKMSHLDIELSKGNEIPLDDNSVDFVVSFQVLEHVGSVKEVLAECERVLKPGGVMYHVCPNYQSFYEGHYRVIWWPFLNKNSGRKYLKMIRKYTPYYEGLNIVKPNYLEDKIKRLGKMDIISLGENEFYKKFSRKQIEKVEIGFIKFILILFLKLGFIARFFLRIVGKLGVYYPITLIARKQK